MCPIAEPGSRSINTRHAEARLTRELCESETNREILILWYRILNEYSLRQLSFETDRLDAISGLAARVAQITGQEEGYIGGIWKRSILDCLQWRSDDPFRGTDAAVRQTVYRAPTWSWASCELLPRSSFRDTRRTLPLKISNDFAMASNAKPMVTVLDVSWKCAGANPFGNLAEAKLRLLCCPLRGFAYAGLSPNLGLDLETLDTEIQELPQVDAHDRVGDYPRNREMAWLHICGRTRTGERASMITTVSPDTSDHRVEGYVYLLPLVDRYIYGNGDMIFCLVVKEAGEGRFERIGHAITRSCYMIKVETRNMELV